MMKKLIVPIITIGIFCIAPYIFADETIKEKYCYRYGDNETRFEEKKHTSAELREEKEAFRSIMVYEHKPSLQGSDSYITIGIGKLSGDTTYQIGGALSTPSGSSQLHFPISELEFPLDIWMISVEGSKEFAKKWKVSVGAKKSYTSDAGKMKDSDWGAWYLDGYAWAEKETLDIYSESDAKLDALIMDINLRYRFYEKSNWSLIAGLGYIRQNFDYAVSNLDQWYPSYYYYYGVDAGHSYVSGKVLTYKITYSIPYIEIGIQRSFKDKFSVDASLGYSSIVDAEDEDVHILRSRVSEADCDGDAIMFFLKGRYDFSKNWFVMAEFDYTKIEVDGKSITYSNGEYSHTIDQEIKSKQIFGVLSVGHAF